MSLAKRQMQGALNTEGLPTRENSSRWLTERHCHKRPSKSLAIREVFGRVRFHPEPFKVATDPRKGSANLKGLQNASGYRVSNPPTFLVSAQRPDERKLPCLNP